MDANARKQLTLRAAGLAERVKIDCRIVRTAAVDPILVTERRNCEVRLMSLPSLEGVYSPKPKPVVVLGSQRPAGRRAFTCAHELGHHEFKHGARLDELNDGRHQRNKDPDEFLADMFAAFLLMSQGSVRRALKDREIQTKSLVPMQIFQLASCFGVGYGSLIDHMTWTLELLTLRQREDLLKIQPKELKAKFGGSPQSEVIIVDKLWKDRAVDLEIGDTLVLHEGIVLEDNFRLAYQDTIDGQETFKATAKGYVRAFDESSDWAVNIRVASKHYQGLARYRFLDDPEESA